MLLINTGTKIVNVGSYVIMPGDSKPFPARMLDTPAIKILCKHGMLKVVEESPEQEAKLEEAEAENAPAELPEEPEEDFEDEDVAVKAEEPAGRKKTSRKKS